MIFRLATAADITDIEQCAKAAYSGYIERMGCEPAPMIADFASQTMQQLVHVLIDDIALVGYAVCYAVEDAYFLENIAVHPLYQSSGYGRMLLKHVHSLACGYAVVRLYTNEKMHENLDWYQRCGYVEISRRVEEGFARVYMEKRLREC